MAKEDPQMKIRLPIELKEKIQELADKNNRSMNAEIVNILTKYLDNDEHYSKDDIMKYVDSALDKFHELIIERDKK